MTDAQVLICRIHEMPNASSSTMEIVSKDCASGGYRRVPVVEKQTICGFSAARACDTGPGHLSERQLASVTGKPLLENTQIGATAAAFIAATNSGSGAVIDLLLDRDLAVTSLSQWLRASAAKFSIGMSM